jgi:ankyrin repeat protein
MLDNNPLFFQHITTFDVSQEDSRGLTLLQLAIFYDKQSHLTEILKRARPEHIQDVVTLAIERRTSSETIRKLIEAGAQISLEHLTKAIDNKLSDDTLLSLFQCISSVSEDSLTKLSLCGCSNNYINFVKSMPLTNYNIQDASGNTLLMLSSLHNCGCLVDYLISKGVNVNQTNNEGFTALMFAAESKLRAVVEKLLTAGADKTIQNTYGETVTSIATFNNDADILSLLNAH